MKKVLFCATIAEHILGFHVPYLEYFNKIGYKVIVATANSCKFAIPYCDEKYDISINRAPFKFSNIKAIRELKMLISDQQPDIIHCHTPMGGVVARIAAKSARKKYGTKVIYTAHGFHFFKGAPIINWILYFSMERLLAPVTDCLITINDEDYKNALKFLKAASIKKINGIGFDKSKFQNLNNKGQKSKTLKEKLGLPVESIILFYAAGLEKNKNQNMLLKVLRTIRDSGKDAYLFLAGEGVLMEEYKRKAKYIGISDYVVFLGWRDDIQEVLKCVDVVTASSVREGLGVNILEAMAAGVPVVATNNRGHREIIKDGVNGFLVEIDEYEKMAKNVIELMESEYLRNEITKNAVNIMDKYDISNVLESMMGIYKDYLE